MSQRLLVKVAVIIYVATGECCGKLIKAPANKTVFEGERIILECETDYHDLKHSIFWKFGNEDIFYGGEISLQYASKFGIQKDHTKGIYNLIIPSATKSHNGRYTCADEEGDGDKGYAWLTVAESPTTKANGNIHSSTGAVALTYSTIIIIIIAVVVISIAVVVLLISVVIFCIYKRKRRNRHEHVKLPALVNVKSDVQTKESANNASAPDSTGKLPWLETIESGQMKDGDEQNKFVSVTDRANEINEQLKRQELEKQEAANRQRKTIANRQRKTDSTKSGLKSKNPNLQEKKKMSELKSQSTFGTKANADAEIKNAESNETKHIADDTFLDNSATPLLLDSSSQSQSQSQTSEQKPKDIKNNEEEASDEENDKETAKMYNL